MSGRDPAAFAQEALGHRFNDRSLLERALAHSSISKDSYQRLEFLGDRVLGMIIARWLYERFPGEPEGQLSRRLNALVSGETCAEVGRRLGLPELIRVGSQARKDSAQHGDNVIGDVVEALIGALLLDGGLNVVEQFVRRSWAGLLEGQGAAPSHPKAALQELAAARGRKAPVYETIARSGADHSPRFTVRVSVIGLGKAEAEGSSKREAETAAAAALLGQLQ